jgi:hypothetical protein
MVVAFGELLLDLHRRGMGLLVITVPNQMPEASNPPLDHLQSRSVVRSECTDSPRRLLDVLDPRGDVPPIQNTGDRLASWCQFRYGLPITGCH